MNNIDIDIDDKEDYWLCSSSESLEAVTETMSQQESFVCNWGQDTAHQTHQIVHKYAPNTNINTNQTQTYIKHII